MVVEAAPPKVISAEEYETVYRPKGFKLLIIGPTSTWRQEWGEWEAIRDIVQNALDETEAYSSGYDDEGFWIADNGRGIAVTDFLLGPPKPKPPYARGRFGEGMKIAALSLLRLGYSVRIETVGKEVWLVFYQQKVNGIANTLAALWRPNGRTSGTVFHIIGYRGHDYRERFVFNLRANIIHRGPSPLGEPIPRYNELISSPAGSLYARDIFMRPIKSKWSYNLWGFALAPDRHAPESEEHMYTDAGRLWATVNDVHLLSEFLSYVQMPPVELFFESEINMDPWYMGQDSTGKRYIKYIEENGERWRKAWAMTFGENAVIRTNDRWDGTVKHLGYTSISLLWGVGKALENVITTDRELVKASQERLSEVKIVPDSSLTPRQLTHLKLARKIASIVSIPEIFDPVSGVHAAIIPPASDRVRTAGLYQKTTATIYIATDQLERARSTVDTMIHELAHHMSGEEDGHPKHNASMTSVAARVVKAASAGEFSEELKEAVW